MKKIEEHCLEKLEQNKYYEWLKSLNKLWEISDEMFEKVSKILWDLSYLNLENKDKLKSSLWDFLWDNWKIDIYERTNRWKKRDEEKLDSDYEKLIKYYTWWFSVNIKASYKNDINLFIILLEKFINSKSKLWLWTLTNAINSYFENKDNLSEQDKIYKNYFEKFLVPKHDEVLKSWDLTNFKNTQEYNKKLNNLYENNYEWFVEYYFSLDYRDVSTHILFIEKAWDKEFILAFKRFIYNSLNNFKNKNLHFYLFKRFISLVWRNEEFHIDIVAQLKKIRKILWNNIWENDLSTYRWIIENHEKTKLLKFNQIDKNSVDFIKYVLNIKISDEDEKEIEKIADRYKNNQIWFIEDNDNKFWHSLKSEILEYFFSKNYENAISFFKRISKNKSMIFILLRNIKETDLIDLYEDIFKYFFKTKEYIKNFWDWKRWFDLIKDTTIFNLLKTRTSNSEILDLFQLQLETHRWETNIARRIENIEKAKQKLEEFRKNTIWVNLSEDKQTSKFVIQFLKSWNPKKALDEAKKLY